ncbi:hypothetical protein Sjap_010187 [Stephania japonica]|uniref:DUF7950 domain-containing protein n=1 Tax=Stephania japonica TaxID=461633 RepID=A0AAP0P658_9MAGN
MIMGSLNIYPASKTEQILSRYRPIAPKPQLPLPNPSQDDPSVPENTQQSFFRNLSTLQTRPSRARKRGRSCISPATYKRAKINQSVLSSSSCAVASQSKTKRSGLSLQGFGRGFPQCPLPNTGLSGNLSRPLNLVTLPFLPYPSSSVSTEVANPVSEVKVKPCCGAKKDREIVLDLNCEAHEAPHEKDLLQGLHAPASAGCGGHVHVIAPHPVRPIGSSISVGSITEDHNSSNQGGCTFKKPEEVEAEIESDVLPAVISDSNNRVRLANSAYKEMVGQPECLWLDSMVNCGGSLSGSAGKRISGEVTLNLLDSHVPICSNGFSCRVRIEWGRKGEKNFVNAPCDVVKLSCKSKDYLFTWRFHTREAAKFNSNVV